MNKIEMQNRTKSFAVRTFKMAEKIVEEETDETLFWIEFIVAVDLIKEKLLSNLMKECTELLAIVTSSLKTSKLKL